MTAADIDKPVVLQVVVLVGDEDCEDNPSPKLVEFVDGLARNLADCEGIVRRKPLIYIFKLRMLTTTVGFNSKFADGSLAFSNCCISFCHQNPTPSSSLSSVEESSAAALPVGCDVDLRLLLMRLGSDCLSRSSPMSSVPGSRNCEIRPISPRTRQAIVSVPMLTPSLPFSSRMIVLSETPMRLANPLMEIRRLTRAVLRFCPSASKARRA